MKDKKIEINLNSITSVTYLIDDPDYKVSSYSVIESNDFFYSGFWPYEDGEYNAQIVWVNSKKCRGLTFEEEEIEIEFEVEAGLDFNISKFLVRSSKEYEEFLNPIFEFFGTSEIGIDNLKWLTGILSLKNESNYDREKMSIVQFIPRKEQQ